MHRTPKRFHIESEIADDSYFIKQREQQTDLLVKMMRDDGYVPLLSLGPFWSTRLNEKGRYDAVLSLYGIYVGKRKSWQIIGMDADGKMYLKPTNSPNDKSTQS